MAARLSFVHVGKVAPLGPKGVPSGFVKRAVEGAVAVAPLGLAGDAQADLTVHGGAEKAVYAYAGSHYDWWRQALPRHADKFVPGAMGENLTIAGMTEDDICVGDVHAVGTARLQVCQPRQPCFKLGLHFGDKLMPKAFVRAGRSGWYYRVLQPGTLAAGDAVTLADRPHPGLAFARLVAIIYHGGPTRAELEAMAAMPGLATQWRDHARALLEG